MYGFPLFNCSCHWLQIERTSKGHVLMLNYGRKGSIPVVTEKHGFVFGNLSTGKFSAEFGGSPEVEVSGIWSMGQLKPGKKGITGKGQLGHAFPRIAPKEVGLFNRLEIQRIEGSSLETIEKFNRRMDPLSIQVHFEVVQDPDENT